MANSPTPTLRPFLKWAGNKFRVLPEILPRLPKGKRLVEPFVGSAAVFLNTHYDEFLLMDINHDLINVYQCLQKNGPEFINHCRQYFTKKTNQEKKYYLYREKFNDCTNPIDRAALFIYLNRHCYNGLCRYNSNGLFNVPFGRFKSPILPENSMKFFHDKSQSAHFVCADFLKYPLTHFNKNDVLYCDPPYAPLNQESNFTRYAAQDFGLEQQNQLALKSQALGQLGAHVLISNHDTPFIRQLYAHAKINSFSVKRHINRNVADRGSVKEILASV